MTILIYQPMKEIKAEQSKFKKVMSYHKGEPFVYGMTVSIDEKQDN